MSGVQSNMQAQRFSHMLDAYMRKEGATGFWTSAKAISGFTRASA